MKRHNKAIEKGLLTPRFQKKDARQAVTQHARKPESLPSFSFLRRERCLLRLNSTCVCDRSCLQEITHAYLFSDESFSSVFSLDAL